MRENGSLYYLLTDHLGSTAVTANASGNQSGELRYKAWGETRYAWGTTPTAYKFTGQRLDDSTGLYYYGARYYDPAVGRFVQPDTIVPEPGNPQALNRYSYVLNNPLRYTDPGGYDPLDAEWERQFREQHGRDPTDQDRRDRLFSLLFLGSGLNGTWTDQDWTRYTSAFHTDNEGRTWNRYWTGEWSWPGAPSPSLGRFVQHLQRLASFYWPWEKDQFVRGFALIFAGIPYSKHWALAAWDVRYGPRGEHVLYEGREGFNPLLVDFPPDPNPSHHYAGLFFLGYFAGPTRSTLVNLARDPDNLPDILLGQISLAQGHTIRWIPGGHYLVGYFVWNSLRVSR